MSEPKETFQTRATLLQRIKAQHDEKSWEDFVHYYRNYIYLICCKMNMSHHEADEVVQQVLIKLWDKLPEFDYDECRRFRSWLCRVVQNTARDHFRKIASRNSLKDKARQDTGIGPSLPEIEAIAEREWNDYLASMALENVRAHFSERMIDIFLRLAAGANPKELGEELGLQPNVIYVYRRRVRDRLKDEVCKLRSELE